LEASPCKRGEGGAEATGAEPFDQRVAPQSDAGWIGEAGPGPSYGDVLEDSTRVGLDNEFTQRNTTFMTWNLLHLAKMLNTAGGFPAYGNQRREWDAGARFDYPNPEYRS
jgi:hypothetical protein